MNKDLLKEYLSSRYQGCRSFLENVIFPIFGEDDFEDGYETELLDSQPERKQLAEATGIRSIKQVGMMYVGAEPLQIFDVTVSDRVMMERNRVNIQRLIRTVMDQFSCAFMLFHYADDTRWDWRFSFCYKSKDENESTDRKRYTFLLGPNQSCRTAAENFFSLYNKHQNDKEIEIGDIINAFSVEALSDEFFNGYKEQYADIIFYITGKRIVKVNNKWEEKQLGDPDPIIMQEFAHFPNPEKAVRDYVKKLMGRLVFLQFLQKKGWLGVPINEEWGCGDKGFTQKLFAKYEDKDHFVDNVLEPLFNDLNTEREGNISQLSVFEYQFKVPYLNGGLFERDAADETQFPLPGEYMGSLLEFFSWYNFTIDENDPDDAEVGVDPEMLGRIFENLLEDNKNNGTFYTPKEIVTYMCRETLIAYLQRGVEDVATKEALRKFVATHDIEVLGTNEKLHQQVLEALEDVKICDPAIGSGAFPMGLLKELFLCRTAIEGIAQSKSAEIKKHIIQHNIYGVDIEKGAVDIARLRFWLSLIVDEETPQALPNLDFKIMQGNSLLEQYSGVDLSKLLPEEIIIEDTGLHATLFDDEFGLEKKELQDLLNKYYECSCHEEKKELRKQISDTIQEQIHNRGINVDFGNLNLSSNREFFLWHTWFHDVFSEGGFDIVIGNPPYVEAKKLKYIASTLKNIYNVYSGTADLSVYFVEHGLNILAENGILCLITTNKFFNTRYGKKLRALITSNSIHKIINFEQVEVFEDILVSSVIIEIAKMCYHRGNTFSYEKFYKLKKEEFLSEFVTRQNAFGIYSQDYLDEKEWSFSDMIQLALKEKIENCSRLLSEIEGVSINRGVTTGYNPAFIITDEKKDELIKEDDSNRAVIMNLLQGRNIRKWFYNESDENLIFTRRGVDISKYPFIEQHLSQFYNQLKPKIKSTDPEGRKPGNYKWFEILDNTAYYPHFEKPEKIIWGLTADKWAFTIDRSQHYLPSNGYILTSTEIPVSYILGVLNSKLMHYYFHFIGIMTAGGAYTLKAATISALPFKIAKDTSEVSSVVDKILSIKENDHDADVSKEESKIDSLVYQLYGLTYDEVLIVDPETPITREEYEQHNNR